jgi:hypothetical protein
MIIPFTGWFSSESPGENILKSLELRAPQIRHVILNSLLLHSLARWPLHIHCEFSGCFTLATPISDSQPASQQQLSALYSGNTNSIHISQNGQFVPSSSAPDPPPRESRFVVELMVVRKSESKRNLALCKKTFASVDHPGFWQCSL